MLLTSSFVASAQEIFLKSSGTFSYWPSLLEDDVAWAEKSLSNYLKKNFGCSIVDLKVDVTKEPGLFSKGTYDLNLGVAACNTYPKHLEFSFDATCNQGYTILDISYYDATGKFIKKSFLKKENDSCAE